MQLDTIYEAHWAHTHWDRKRKDDKHNRFDAFLKLNFFRVCLCSVVKSLFLFIKKPVNFCEKSIKDSIAKMQHTYQLKSITNQSLRATDLTLSWVSQSNLNLIDEMEYIHTNPVFIWQIARTTVWKAQILTITLSFDKNKRKKMFIKSCWKLFWKINKTICCPFILLAHGMAWQLWLLTGTLFCRKLQTTDTCYNYDAVLYCFSKCLHKYLLSSFLLCTHLFTETLFRSIKKRMEKENAKK